MLARFGWLESINRGWNQHFLGNNHIDRGLEFLLSADQLMARPNFHRPNDSLIVSGTSVGNWDTDLVPLEEIQRREQNKRPNISTQHRHQRTWLEQEVVTELIRPKDKNSLKSDICRCSGTIRPLNQHQHLTLSLCPISNIARSWYSDVIMPSAGRLSSVIQYRTKENTGTKGKTGVRVWVCGAQTLLVLLTPPRRLCPFVGLFVCLFVWKNTQNTWKDYNDTWWKDMVWVRKDLSQFWCRSGSGGVSPKEKNEPHLMSWWYKCVEFVQLDWNPRDCWALVEVFILLHVFSMRYYKTNQKSNIVVWMYVTVMRSGVKLGIRSEISDANTASHSAVKWRTAGK